MNGPDMSCKRGHRLVRWEPLDCAGGHQHLVAVCPMRVGNRRCGEEHVIPPFGDICED